MKRNILQQAVFALAMLGHTALSAQYIVGGCETETGVLTVAQETFTVTAGGRFINSGTVHFTGVNTLTNHGGLSEQVESACTADYRNPCGNTPGTSGANIFDNSVLSTTINGDNPLRMYAATIDRNIQLDNEWQIIQTFTFTTGMVTTDRADLSHFLHFRGSSSVVGAATVKHVNGYAGWSGTGPFTLPVGDGMKYRPVELEGNCSTVFQAAYFSGDPGLATLPAGAPFSTASKPAGVTVSQSGYWDINGASATPITLHFDADSDLDLIATDLSQLVILGWNGTAWVSLGQTGSTGILAGSGTVTCGAVVPDGYGAYALGTQCSNAVSAAIAGPALVCPGESATLTATGGVSYAWSTGGSGATVSVSPSETTTYSVTATDANGCTGTASFVLNVTPQTLSDTPLEYFWVTDGEVSAIQYDPTGDVVYLGGVFNMVGPVESYGAGISLSTGAVDFSFLNPNGAVRDAVPDGAGGWYIGGDFTEVGGQTRNYLARIKADGSLHAWNAGTNGAVFALALSGTTLYVGGFFTNVEGQSRNRIAALDVSTGQLTSWNPNANALVLDLAVSGGTVYVGGSFTNIGGQSRSYLAALDATTGLATTWNPNGNNAVGALLVNGGLVYAGGDFTNIGGQSRNRLAALDAATGLATTWNPDADGGVSALVLNGGTVYVGGTFNNVGGQSRNHIAALDAATGLASAWNPNANNGVAALAVSGGTVYAGGNFTNIGGESRSYLAALDTATGEATAWNPVVFGGAFSGVQTLAVSGDKLYVGGGFTSIGGQRRSNIAALHATTGQATSWNPGASGPVYALAASGSTVYAGGDFTGIGGQSRSYLAALDAATGQATAWNPNPNYIVQALARNGGTIYAGGFFSNIGGQSRDYLAALDATTGLATTWNPNADGGVSALALNGGTVYVGGGFASIGGAARNNLAALDAATGLATAWNPNIGGSVSALALGGSTVYAGGDFFNAGGESRSRLAALDAATGLATDWNPNANLTVRSLIVRNDLVFAGGDFSMIGGFSKNRLAAVDVNFGYANSWNPVIADGSVTVLAQGGGKLYAGGGFTAVGGKARGGFAAFSLPASCSASPASSTPSLCAAAPLTPITHSTEGATGIGDATGLPAGVSASWASNTITISGTPTESGIFAYSIPLTGGCCETVFATGTITVHPVVTAAISGPASICPGESATLTATGGVSYAWSTGGSGETANVSPTEATTYSVTATDAEGCTGTASIILSVKGPEEPCEVGLTLEVPEAPVVCGNMVTYRVRAAGMDGQLSGLQFSVNWDMNKMEYLGYTLNSTLYAAAGETPTINLTTTDAAEPTGALTYIWADLEPPYGLTAPDNSEILSLSFRAIGLGELNLSITNHPVEILIYDADFAELPLMITEPDPAQNTTICNVKLTVDTPTDPYACGEFVTVPIRASGLYGDVSDLLFSVNWDPTQLEYVSHEFDPAVYEAGGDEPVIVHPATVDPLNSDGALSFSWGDIEPPYGRPIATDAAIMEVTFRVVNSGELPISITGTPTEILAADNINFETIFVITENSAVHVPHVAPVVACPPNVAIQMEAGVPCAVTIPDLVEDLEPSDDCTPAGNLVEAQDIPAGLYSVSGASQSVVVTYKVTDQALNTTTCVVTYSVIDGVAPEVECPPAQIELPMTATGACEITIPDFIEDLDPTDNCTAATSLLEQQSIPPGPYTVTGAGAMLMVTYTVQDNAIPANVATCTMAITVTDDQPPSFICPPGLTVDTNGDPDCAVMAPNLVAQITDAADNCGVVTLSQSPPAGATQTGISDGGTFQVTVSALDQAGNPNAVSCVVQVTVNDNDAPVVACPPTDITLSTNPGASCQITIPNYVDQLAPIDNCTAPAAIKESQTPLAGPYIVPGDGATVTVTYSTVDDAVPANLMSCTIVITVNDDVPPTFSCPPNTTVSATGGSNCAVLVPDLTAGITDAADNCGTLQWTQTPVAGSLQPGIPYDGTFDVTVSLSDGNGNSNVTPCVVTLTFVEPFTLSTTKTDVSCHGGSNGAINLEVSGNTAPFGYDWSNDGAEDPDNDPQDLANLNAGIYTVTVTDATGCSLTTSQTIVQPLPLTIVSIPADATATGTPPHHNCLTTSDVQGQFIAWLNATPFATSGGVNPLPPSISYAVTDIANNTSVTSVYTSLTPTPAPPADGGYTTVTWTAADACVTLSATRTFSVNPCMRVSGAVRFFRDNSGVQDVAMDMVGTGAVDAASGSTGAYSVYSATSGVYTVTPSKTLLTGTLTPASTLSNVHGINVTDVQAILAHVGSGTAFTSIYQRVAANVVLGSTGSETNNRLTSADATSLSQAINGSTVQQARLRWRFIPSDANLLLGAPTTLPRSWGLVPNALAGVQSPASYGKYFEWKQYNPLTGPMTGQHFTAVRVGDVVPNPSVTGNPGAGLRYAGAPLVWRVRDQQLRAGETIELVFRADQLSNLTGWQFGLYADPAYLQALSVSAEPVLSLDPEVHFGLYDAERGDIRSLWADAERKSLPAGTPVFRLRFRVLQGDRLLSDVLRLDDAVLACFALSDSQLPVGILLQFEGAPGAAAVPVLRQNTPNPFDKETRVQFELPAASDILLRIHDVNGRLIKEFSGYYAAGLHELRFGRGELGQHTGVLFYTLRCGEFTATRRMVVME